MVWSSIPFSEGESIKLTAVPNGGYRFSGWAESEDGEVIETDSAFVIESYDGSVTTLVALFVKVANITYDVNGATKGADWTDSEPVDVGTNLSKVRSGERCQGAGRQRVWRISDHNGRR